MTRTDPWEELQFSLEPTGILVRFSGRGPWSEGSMSSGWIAAIIPTAGSTSGYRYDDVAFGIGWPLPVEGFCQSLGEVQPMPRNRTMARNVASENQLGRRRLVMTDGFDFPAELRMRQRHKLLQYKVVTEDVVSEVGHQSVILMGVALPVCKD